MSSDAKIEASRTNGRQSRGPVTAEGKAASAQNAIKHGLCAERLVVPGECPEEFADFRGRLWDDLHPCGAVEEALAERIVGAFWRLRRSVRIEAEILDRVGESRRMKDFAHFRISERQLGWAFEAANPATLDRLGRYETRLERSLARAIHEFQRVRTGVVPLAIDVDLDVTRASAASEHDDGTGDEFGFVSQKAVRERERDLRGPPTLADLVPGLRRA